MAECKNKAKEEEEAKINESAKLNYKASADMMAKYLKDGELNPAVVATQSGFLRLFAAWILDESLPWTTGEAPALHLLFKYLKVNFILPTDTTVKNQLVRIFAELHGKVVREFSVRLAYLNIALF